MRAKEYAATRKTAIPALQKCARLADESVHLILGLVVGKDGSVQRAQVDGGYSQYKAARCVEKTIMTIAKFSAASDRTFLSFPIFLDAEKRTAR